MEMFWQLLQLPLPTPLTYLDEDIYSNIVVYDDTQWIGYMDDENKAGRLLLYQAYNLGGTADWAVDLQSYTGDTGSSSGGGSVVSVPSSLWTETNSSVTGDPPCILVLHLIHSVAGLKS
jgi:chitinase